MKWLRRVYDRHRWIRGALSPVRDLRTRVVRARRDYRARDLDRIISLLADDPVLNVDEFEGKFRVGRESSILVKLLLEGAYEQLLAKALTRVVDRNRDAIDVGANVGFYTVLLSKQLLGRRVLAFEPVDEALARLRYNLDLNGVDDRVTICPMVASDREGTIEMKVVVGREEYSTVGSMQHPQVQTAAFTTRRVGCTTVDQQVDEHGLVPGLIKIDAEGSEHRVLQGCVNTLRHHRPLILSEFSDALLRANGSSAVELLEYTAALGYHAIDPLRPDVDFYSKDFGDVLLVPKESHDSVLQRIAK